MPSAGAAAQLRTAIEVPLSPAEYAELEGRLRSARQASTEAAGAAAWAAGRALSLEHAITQALEKDAHA